MPLSPSPDRTTGQEVRLASRPIGKASLENFELANAEVPEPKPGQIVVRNTWMSVDPYMRGRMNAGKSYIAPFELGAALEGHAVGEVVSSRSEGVPVGATVTHFLGWRDYSVLDADGATVVDTATVPARAYLGLLGMPGLTAYATLAEVAPVRQGDVVYVSAAAGAVGSYAGQIARKLGASRVIGSAGGPRKVAKLVTVFGFDVGLDYRARPLGEQLAEAAPDGIDVYVDNVGGDHLEAALSVMREGGRVGMVGAISGYNSSEPVPGPRNLFETVRRQLTLRGMLVTSYGHLADEYTALASGWLADGSVRTEETVVDRLDQAPAALLGLLRGENIGKMLVQIAG